MEGRYPRGAQDQVEAMLSSYGAGAIVVGHTEAEQIEGFSLQALLWKGDTLYRVTGSGELQPIE